MAVAVAGTASFPSPFFPPPSPGPHTRTVPPPADRVSTLSPTAPPIPPPPGSDAPPPPRTETRCTVWATIRRPGPQRGAGQYGGRHCPPPPPPRSPYLACISSYCRTISSSRTESRDGPVPPYSLGRRAGSPPTRSRSSVPPPAVPVPLPPSTVTLEALLGSIHLRTIAQVAQKKGGAFTIAILLRVWG